jgi:hypothetical protein
MQLQHRVTGSPAAAGTIKHYGLTENVHVLLKAKAFFFSKSLALACVNKRTRLVWSTYVTNPYCFRGKGPTAISFLFGLNTN